MQTRSDKPNENWTGDENFLVVEDGTELANKIIQNYPCLDLVIDNNVLVDITPTERVYQQPEPTEQERINAQLFLELAKIKAGVSA